MFSTTPPRAAARRSLTMILAATGILLSSLAIRSGLDSLSPTVAPVPAAIDPTGPAGLQGWQERLHRNPEDSYAYAQLGLALLQQIRENGDVAAYPRAAAAFDAALARDPRQVDALVGRGMLALSRHRFHAALAWADRARAINPYRAEILGLRVDALVELGRYPEAISALQQMMDLRPGLAAYSRVSYLRELHGDVAGAIEAMQAAVAAGVPGREETLWATVQLGNLHFNRGDLEQAEAAYGQALRGRPGYVHAWAGLANVQAGRGHCAAAIDAYVDTVHRLPLPQYAIALGDLYQANGQPNEARRYYDLVRAIQQLNAGAGMDVDLELALFEVDHGADPAAALARARRAYRQRPNIYAADALAWALYRNGNYIEAWQAIQEALRLGTRDPLLHYHAGRIAYARRDWKAARAHLARALAINPAFSVLHAPRARTTLARLGYGQPPAARTCPAAGAIP